MTDMNVLLKKIYDKNVEFDRDQKIFHGKIPEEILMINKIRSRHLSPEMKKFYEFALEWKEGLMGFDTINPNGVKDLYDNTDVKESIDLIAENYKPIPPSDPLDWEKTALFAVEAGGLGGGLCFYWWKDDNIVEPCVIAISGGSINIFVDLNELFEHLANGIFPEKGDEIYRELEEKRGTLSD